MLTTDGDSRPQLDTTSCDREPIHIPGSIQPHGVLAVLAEPDLSVSQVSENTEATLGVNPADVLGRPLETLIGAENARTVAAALGRVRSNSRPSLLGNFLVAGNGDGGGAGRTVQAVAHRAESDLILELEFVSKDESIPDIHPLIDEYTLLAEKAESVAELSRILAEEVRGLTGFDRVLIYQFDESWHGTVVGEAGNERLPSLLDHRFPAGDIPAQARELYRINRIRIIPDSDYRPVAIIPRESRETGAPLDLTFSALRSVSPVHVEYMRNMETAASMSVSIMRGGQLWGLIACHHREPKTVPYVLRTACDLLARTFSLRLSALEHAEDFERRIQIRSSYLKLLEVMANRGDFAEAITEIPGDLLDFADAHGAAVLTKGECRLFGETPSETQVRDLADWLFQVEPRDVFSSDFLSRDFPPAIEYKDKASGLLSVAISKISPSYVLWFRPEVIQVVKWGGAPHDSHRANGSGHHRLHPRTSFATWQETVRGFSTPWRGSDIEAATEFRNTIVGTVLRKAEELAALNEDLVRSNRELEAFSYSVSHDLRAPLRHIVGYAEMLREGSAGRFTPKDERFIATIIESSEYAGKLVDKLLGYSRLGRSQLNFCQVDLNVLVREIRDDVMRDVVGRSIDWEVADLPTVAADLMMLRMAIRDLLSNAAKYTRKRDEARIEVGSRDEGSEWTIFVKDNGVGFDMEFSDKLFGVFQRLHRFEDYEGTGIGLANVRRVIERHGGRTWAYGEEGNGATFFFSLPKTSSTPRGEVGC